MSACPNRLTLEEHLMGVSSPVVVKHVESCDRCGTRLEEMRRLSAEFRRVVYPSTVNRVVDSVDSPRWIAALLRWTPVPAFAAAAAACALLLIQPSPSADYVGTKGSNMLMTVYARTLDGSEALADGSRVPPGTALRFRVHAPDHACKLWLVSVDETGVVSRLYPTTGDVGATVPADPLPGGVILDQRTGPERIFAVCSPEPIQYRHVERAALAAASGGAERVRAAQALPDLPPAAVQTTLLLEKSR